MVLESLVFCHQAAAVSITAPDETGPTQNGEVSVGSSDLLSHLEKKSRSTVFLPLSHQGFFISSYIIIYAVFEHTSICPSHNFLGFFFSQQSEQVSRQPCPDIRDDVTLAQTAGVPTDAGHRGRTLAHVEEHLRSGVKVET